MEQITAWAAGLCLCTMVCTVLDMMTPDGSMEKTVRFVLGLFMVCAVALPLAGMSLDFDEIAAAAQYDLGTDLTEEIQSQSIRVVSQEVEALVMDVLEDIDVVPAKTEINTDIDSDNRISIVSVTVFLESGDAEKSVQVKNKVETELGITCDTAIAD